jgi:hypothetical protein
MPRGAVNLAPHLRVIRRLKMPLLFLLRGLLAVISVVSSVLVIAPVSCADLTILLLPLGPLAPGFQKSSLGFRSLYAYVGDCKQIIHRLGLRHDDLLHSLDIADLVTKGVDDLDVLDVRDNVPDVPKMFHVVPETFIMLLPDGLQGLYCRWTLIRAL